MTSNYDILLSELHAAQRRRPEPSFDPSDIAVQRRQFAKSIAGTLEGLSRLVPAKRKPVQRTQRQDAGTVLRKALSLFQAGQIDGDQLRRIEAAHHQAVDALAQRGAL